MAFNLAALLGQQSSVLARPPYTTPGIGDGLDEILVQADRGRPEGVRPVFNDVPEREAIDPRYVLNDDRIAPTKDELKEILPREGMFGVKGTLRDVLGLLGDAFLVQGGGKTVYQPQRERERAGDAMFGMANDPRQAAERLAAAGYPEEAARVLQEANTVDYRDAQLSSLEGSRQDQARNRQRDDTDRARDQIARYFNVAGDNPQRLAFVYQMAQKMAEELGVPVESLIPGPNLSPDERAVYGAGDMTVPQQENLERRDRSLDISQQNADSARITATRSRATARPRSQTELEYYQEVSDIPAGQRTPEQKAFMEKYTRGSGRGSRLGATPPPPPGGGSTSRFRPVR